MGNFLFSLYFDCFIAFLGPGPLWGIHLMALDASWVVLGRLGLPWACLGSLLGASWRRLDGVLGLGTVLGPF